MNTSILTLLTLTLITFQTIAEPMSASKGLEKIKTNLENAKKNKSEYDKNLELVKSNVIEVQKAKEATLAQKKMVTSEITKNNESLKKIQNQERDITAYIAKEGDKINVETKQIEQLQNLITQIKKNQEQRNAIIADYQAQLGAASSNKKAWKEREDQLKAQENKTATALRGIASEESSWIGKKKKYESEVKRWSAETEKQQKIHDTYQGLAEGK
jgi:chromosome segregation ATPase